MLFVMQAHRVVKISFSQLGAGADAGTPARYKLARTTGRCYLYRSSKQQQQQQQQQQQL
jgi:hypothetical protein